MRATAYNDLQWSKLEETEPFPWRHYLVKQKTESHSNPILIRPAEYVGGHLYNEEGVKLDASTIFEFHRMSFRERQNFG